MGMEWNLSFAQIPTEAKTLLPKFRRDWQEEQKGPFNVFRIGLVFVAEPIGD
jgi:uncharacterized membrane protein